MIEGSGSGSISLTNGSGSGRPKTKGVPVDSDPQHCSPECPARDSLRWCCCYCWCTLRPAWSDSWSQCVGQCGPTTTMFVLFPHGLRRSFFWADCHWIREPVSGLVPVLCRSPHLHQEWLDSPIAFAGVRYLLSSKQRQRSEDGLIFLNDRGGGRV